jgi:hypothetical protein
MGLGDFEFLKPMAISEKLHKASIFQSGIVHGQSRDGGPLLRKCGFQELLPAFAARKSLAGESV